MNMKQKKIKIEPRINLQLQHIHPIEKTLSGEKHKSVMMQPNGGCSKNYEWFEKSYQKLERVFHQVSKHLKVGQKNLAAPRFFNPLLGVWIS